jgi:aspartyl-tRNA(Asn)/glutamyl-tRNA(Gln) amidotransferase subunit A
MFNELTIIQARKGLDKKEFTSVELTEACLDRIKKRNKNINAFISVLPKQALDEAKKADKLITTGKQQPLTGIPFGVKDSICTDGVRSTGAAKILDNYVAPYEATVIKKIRDQGAVLLGKQNCDSFGHGASNENSMYGPVKNPHDETHVAGGSSGGSAAAVADNQCIFSIAEDTGGSIRQPASLCGVYGYRPSYGRNSRYGVMPMASSLDTVGPIAKSVEDIAILMEIMAGQDPLDATTLPDNVPSYSKNIKDQSLDVKSLRIGVPKEYFSGDGIDKEVFKLVKFKIDNLKKLGAKVIDVSLPYTKYAIPVYYIVVPSEDSSNMARLDGVRYGVKIPGRNLDESYANSRSSGFPEEVKRRIMIGTYALSAGYYDAYYRQAQKVRTLIKQELDRIFDKIDVLLTPTSPFPAFKIGEKKNDVLSMYLADAYVAPSALSGIPGISLPIDSTASGLPVGLQILGPRMADANVLQTAYVIDQI